jgi:hypothetical protein
LAILWFVGKKLFLWGIWFFLADCGFGLLINEGLRLFTIVL